jgi:hypothetical protein
MISLFKWLRIGDIIVSTSDHAKGACSNIINTLRKLSATIRMAHKITKTLNLAMAMQIYGRKVHIIFIIFLWNY